MKTGAKIAILLVSFLFVGFVIFGSMTRAQVECEVCIEFRGRTDCRRAAGVTEDEARRTAQTMACGILAAGMDQTIACGRVIPKSVQCSAN
ncbi:MAG: hypothetical protein O7D29_06355 [Gemmatimonadetes bacterium]|nr:hypothetical protein [Gemmatimonadota bacterium]